MGTRNTLERSLPEIIDALIGDEDVSGDVRTALLVAQAAERTYNLATKAWDYAQKHEAHVNYYRALNRGLLPSLHQYVDEEAVGVIAYDSPVFKSVGSKHDPELLRRAQATWMAAQIYMNNEISSIKDDVTENKSPEKKRSMGPMAADGFKKSASEFYILAAQILRDEKYPETAEKFEAVGNAMLKYGVDNKNAPPPTRFLMSLLNQERHGHRDSNSVLSGEAWTLPKEYKDTLEKLINLTSPQGPPASKTAHRP
jgi:hypothetical protein